MIIYSLIYSFSIVFLKVLRVSNLLTLVVSVKVNREGMYSDILPGAKKCHALLVLIMLLKKTLRIL